MQPDEVRQIQGNPTTAPHALPFGCQIKSQDSVLGLKNISIGVIPHRRSKIMPIIANTFVHRQTANSRTRLTEELTEAHVEQAIKHLKRITW